jgi:hypothetical protein
VTRDWLGSHADIRHVPHDYLAEDDFGVRRTINHLRTNLRLRISKKFAQLHS